MKHVLQCFHLSQNGQSEKATEKGWLLAVDLNESKFDKTQNTSEAFEKILIQLIILQEHS